MEYNNLLLRMVCNYVEWCSRRNSLSKTLSANGAFSMVIQDIINQVKENLLVINIVFTNKSFCFIESEQEDAQQTKFEVYLQDMDFGKTGEAMGAKGFTVIDPRYLAEVFDEAKIVRYRLLLILN